jgi:hypothetical protein
MGTTVGIGTMIAMIGIIIETGMAAAVTETIPEIIGTAEIRGTTGIEISVVAMIEIGGTDRLTEARSETHHSLCNTSHLIKAFQHYREDAFAYYSHRPIPILHNFSNTSLVVALAIIPVRLQVRVLIIVMHQTFLCLRVFVLVANLQYISRGGRKHIEGSGNLAFSCFSF